MAQCAEVQAPCKQAGLQGRAHCLAGLFDPPHPPTPPACLQVQVPPRCIRLLAQVPQHGAPQPPPLPLGVHTHEVDAQRGAMLLGQKMRIEGRGSEWAEGWAAR